YVFFLTAEDGVRHLNVTGVQTCALPISPTGGGPPRPWTCISPGCVASSVMTPTSRRTSPPFEALASGSNETDMTARRVRRRSTRSEERRVGEWVRQSKRRPHGKRRHWTE